MGTPVLPERHQGHVPCAAQIMAHHLQPALEWAREHRGALVASSGEQAVAGVRVPVAPPAVPAPAADPGWGSLPVHAMPSSRAVDLLLLECFYADSYTVTIVQGSQYPERSVFGVPAVGGEVIDPGLAARSMHRSCPCGTAAPDTFDYITGHDS